MSIRLEDLVAQFGGDLQGDPALVVQAIAPLSNAGPEDISFLSNPRFRDLAAHSHASALILSPVDHAEITSYGGARIVTANPYAYFARTAQLFFKLAEQRPAPGISPAAYVDPSAKIAATASIGPMAVIEANADIGENVIVGAGCHIGRAACVGAHTHLHPRVTLLERCIIGQRGIVHSGVVIGGDGFGFASENGTWIKIPQTGRVVIGDDVEIGANTTIDRGALEDTVLEDDVKLDNQIQIAHNCRIGAHTAIAACTGIAGSAIIGRYCTISGGVRIQGHAVIADKVHIGACCNVLASITEPGHYSGLWPISSHREWEKSAAIVRNLPALRDKIRTLEKAVRNLSAGSAVQPASAASIEPSDTQLSTKS